MTALFFGKIAMKGVWIPLFFDSGSAVSERVCTLKGSGAVNYAFYSLIFDPGATLDIYGVGDVKFTLNNYAPTVLTVPEGCSINGAQTDNTQPFMMRVVEDVGGLALQTRRRPGTALSFR